MRWRARRCRRPPPLVAREPRILRGHFKTTGPVRLEHRLHLRRDPAIAHDDPDFPPPIEFGAAQALAADERLDPVAHDCAHVQPQVLQLLHPEARAVARTRSNTSRGSVSRFGLIARPDTATASFVTGTTRGS